MKILIAEGPHQYAGVTYYSYLYINDIVPSFTGLHNYELDLHDMNSRNYIQTLKPALTDFAKTYQKIYLTLRPVRKFDGTDL